MIVFIKDTNALVVEEFFQGQFGRLAKRAREGAVNPDAPACSTSSILQNGVPMVHSSELKLILPHNLLDKKRLL